MVISAILTALGSCLRCLPLLLPSLSLPAYTALARLAACLVAAAGPTAMAAPLQLSAAWFPPGQRQPATSVAQLCNALGVGGSFLYGLALVRCAPLRPALLHCCCQGRGWSGRWSHGLHQLQPAHLG